MKKYAFLLASGAVFAVFGVFAGRATAEPIDFAHDVVPILKKHCVTCHGGNESKGGFSLNTRALLLESESVVPGKPADSRLIELLESTDPEEQMPPKDRPRLSVEERRTLRTWVEQGLAWEDGFSFTDQRYEPPLQPRRPELPVAEDGRTNPVDRLVDAYLRQNGVARPAPVSDAAFLRRVSLDLVGLLPEPERLKQFLADPNPAKREQLVKELLSRDVDYAEHWLTFWNDLLRNDYSGTGFITGGRKQISAWLYQSLVQNKPYDQFVRELIAPSDQSDGFIRGIRWRGDVNASQTQEIQFAQNVGQAFLGINLKCASCHDSFIDRWTLQETYGLAQIYATEPLTLHRCDKSTGKPAQAAWLFPELGEVDAVAPQPERLRQLAALLTHSGNGRFTRTMVNRIWHRLMGRGLVHPVDAMHTAPWNADLLDFLAVDLADHGYDLKRTMELICTSQAYQAVTPAVDPSSMSSEYVFRGPLARRMTAEQFLDSVWQITGSAPARFDAPVLRVKLGADTATTKVAPSSARWIWSNSQAGSAAPKPGEAISARRQFELSALPSRAIVAVTCDNEYQLLVNSRVVVADSDWETVEVADLLPFLKVGKNDLLVVAKNAGAAANPAGLLLEVRLGSADHSGADQTIGTDRVWEWTSTLPDARGKFAKEPSSWQPAAEIDSPNPWDNRIRPRFGELLAAAGDSATRMVRASLMKNDELMTALGRPTRDQIVSMRPSELTTLEAIDLANGQVLADAVAAGGGRLVADHQGDSVQLTRRLFEFALSRPPTPTELGLAVQLLGAPASEQAAEDLLWSVFMLPEFQLNR